MSTTTRAAAVTAAVTTAAVTTASLPAAPPRRPVRRPVPVLPVAVPVPVALAVVAVAASAALAVVAAATVGGAASPPLLADPGALTRWGLLGSRVVADVTATVAVGAVVVAAVALPRGPGATLGEDGLRLLRLAARWSAAWAAASLVAALFTLSDVAGRGVVQVLAPDVLPLALDLPQTRALLSAAWLAALVTVFGRRASTVAGARLVLLTAGCALLPPLLTAHAAHEDGRVLATTGLVVHVAAASVWLGGLAAMALHLRHRPVPLAAALPRWSRAALVCFVLVAASGAVTASVLMDRPAQLLSTPYGRLLVVKLVVLVLLGTLGYLHRRRTVPAVLAGRPRAFLALAVVELVVMAAAVGLAVGLARTAPPADGGHGGPAPAPVARAVDAPAAPAS